MPSLMTETRTPRAVSSLRRYRLAMAISGVAIVVQIILSLWLLSALPADSRVPMHWNASGEIDGWGSRASVWILPATVLGLTLLFFFLPRIEPRREHLERSSGAYQATWISMLVFFTLLHLAIILTALGHAVDMNRWIGTATGILFGVIGGTFGRIESNYFFGIRTPWTLASERAWKATHRVGGRLFVVLGLTIALLALAGAPGTWMWGTMVIGVLILIPVTFVISYRTWKNDPDRAESLQ